MDEADRMVNLGFEADLTFILDKLPSDTMEGEEQGEQMDVDGETMVKRGRTRVTTLFSATMPPPVERLTKKYLKKPAIITIGEAGRAVDTVEQRVEFVSGDEKKKYVLTPSATAESVNDGLIAGSACWRSSIATSSHHQSLCSSTRRRRRTWSQRICTEEGYVRRVYLVPLCAYTVSSAVERRDLALGQEPGAARSCSAISAHR